MSHKYLSVTYRVKYPPINHGGIKQCEPCKKSSCLMTCTDCAKINICSWVINIINKHHMASLISLAIYTFAHIKTIWSILSPMLLCAFKPNFHYLLQLFEIRFMAHILHISNGWFFLCVTYYYYALSASFLFMSHNDGHILFS